MELDKNGVQKIECIRSNVEFKEGICIISNRKSEVLILDMQILSIKIKTR